MQAYGVDKHLSTPLTIANRPRIYLPSSHSNGNGGAQPHPPQQHQQIGDSSPRDSLMDSLQLDGGEKEEYKGLHPQLGDNTTPHSPGGEGVSGEKKRDLLAFGDDGEAGSDNGESVLVPRKDGENNGSVNEVDSKEKEADKETEKEEGSDDEGEGERAREKKGGEGGEDGNHEVVVDNSPEGSLAELRETCEALGKHIEESSLSDIVDIAKGIRPVREV